MLFKDIAIIDENLDYQEHQWVGVLDGAIDYIGGEEPADAAKYGEVYEGEGRLLMPAFYNAHAHAPMTLLRGYAENLPLQAWLETKCWPFEGKMVAEDNYWATLLAGAEMLRYGVVSATDMYMKGKAMGEGFRDGGVKANFSIGASNLPATLIRT